MKKLLKYELSFLDIFGRKSHCTPADLLYIMSSKHMVAYTLIILLLFILVDPFAQHGLIPLYQVVAFWGIAITRFATIYLLVGLAVMIIVAQTKYQHIYFPIIGIISATLNTIVVNIHVSVIETRINSEAGFIFDGGNLFEHWLLFAVANLIIETHFFAYVWPPIENGIQKIKMANIDAPPIVLIKGHSVNTRLLLALHSRGHYVDIIMSSSTIVVRARLSDIIGCFDPELGLTTHRSYWVTKHSIKSITNLPSFRELTLTNGAIIPVSAPRMATVLNLELDLPE